MYTNAPSIRAPNYVKQTLLYLKGEIGFNTLRVGDINSPLLLTDI